MSFEKRFKADDGSWTEWESSDEAEARRYLGSHDGSWTFHVAVSQMLRGDAVEYCGLIQFRLAE
jgi:hypothetical protein